MSGFRDIPSKIKQSKTSKSEQIPGLRYSVAEMKGWRNEMEDAYCANMNKPDGWSFFGIFDGHGGDFSSKHVSEHLWNRIYDELMRKKNSKSFDDLSEEQVIEAVKLGFLNLDKEMREKAISPDNDPTAYYQTFLDKSGTTVVACLITKKHIYLINCGDSRGILVRRPCKLELVTYDHKPSQLKEKQRIQNAGGMIALNRVNGGLATSRGLGDFEYKCVNGLESHQQFVSSEPDFYVIERDLKKDFFVVLACDGIWDVKTNEVVMSYVKEKIDNTSRPDDFENITRDLVDSCFDAGSKDNMSVIVIQFQPDSIGSSNQPVPSGSSVPNLRSNSGSMSNSSRYHHSAGITHPPHPTQSMPAKFK